MTQSNQQSIEIKSISCCDRGDKTRHFWFMTREESVYSQTRALARARVERLKALEGTIVRGIVR